MAIRSKKWLCATLLFALALADPVIVLAAPGDYRGGYDTPDYRTQSEDLLMRKGSAADLLGAVRNPPLGLPPVPIPTNNPISATKIKLGRKLFFDRRLSLNNTMSCAMCHIPEQGFTNNEINTAVGIEGRTVRRNTPTSYNVAYLKRLFWDGRETTLEHQIWAPLLSHQEMGNPSPGAVIEKIRALPDYRGLFQAAFEGRGVSMETLGMALASYERTLVSADSPFDRWYYGKQDKAISVSAKRGFELFTGAAGCSACHKIGTASALFTDNAMHNTGVGYARTMQTMPATRKVTLAPGISVDVPTTIINSVGDARLADLGLSEVTQKPTDRWKYRTPSLRNVALTAPYMHDGSMASLGEVVEFYNQGGFFNESIDSRIHPLALTKSQRADLVAFLMTLTGSNVATLVDDAFAAPVGDWREGDPEWAHSAVRNGVGRHEEDTQ